MPLATLSSFPTTIEEERLLCRIPYTIVSSFQESAQKKREEKGRRMAADEPISNPEFVDDIYFSAVSPPGADAVVYHDDEEGGGPVVFPVSDLRYAEGLQLQEVLMGSVIISQQKGGSNCSPSSSTSVMRFMVNPEGPLVVTEEAGESSLSFCEICMERMENDRMFRMGKCVHSFCSECVCKHVATKLQESSGGACMLACPGLDCKAVLELDACRAMLPKGVVDQWEDALCQELIGASQKFYCPFNDCAGLFVNEDDGEVIREAECPFCHRLFCAQCHVPWHSGVECGAFRNLNEGERGKEDLMVMQLAKDKKWSRCPNCQFYVERSEGCPHMICRCKFEFCYGCGEKWSPSHGGCQKN